MLVPVIEDTYGLCYRDLRPGDIVCWYDDVNLGPCAADLIVSITPDSDEPDYAFMLVVEPTGAVIKAYVQLPRSLCRDIYRIIRPDP